MKKYSLRRNDRTTRSIIYNKHPHLTWEWLLVAGLLALVSGIILMVFTGTAASHQQAGSPGARTHSSSNGGLSAQSLLASNTPGIQPTLPTGIFPSAKDGPVPVPANVMTPTNMARIVMNNIVTDIYAGVMTRNSQTGALAVLQENLITGQESLHMYQTAQPVGALTILALRKNTILLSASHAPGSGTFDLKTDQFHF